MVHHHLLHLLPMELQSVTFSLAGLFFVSHTPQALIQWSCMVIGTNSSRVFGYKGFLGLGVHRAITTNDVPHIIIHFIPHCTRMFCFSWFIFCFDCPSPKWQCHPVLKRTLANKRREEWRWEEISGTLKGLENLPTGEFFLEYLDCESTKSWFWALGFLENWIEIH